MVSIARRDAGYSPLELLAIGATHVEPEWSVEERSEISKEHWCLRVASKPGDWGEKRWRVAMFKRFLIKSAQRLSERKIRGKNKLHERDLILVGKELKWAEDAMIRAVQLKHFEKEILSLV